MNLNRYKYALSAIVLITIIPFPKGWDFVIDPCGALLSDKVWYIGVYLILTTAFFIISKLAKDIFFKVIFLLSIGKLIDQFSNPYGYHAPEIIWDAIILIWATIQYIKWKKTTAAS